MIKKVVFFSIKQTLALISYFSHRVYMKYYIPLLKWMGLIINGTPRYIATSVRFDDYRKISMGNRVVVSGECHFLTHDYSLTTALIAKGNIPTSDKAIIRGISVGNNVFIGRGSVIMPGTVIEDNVIIGAGSVVRGHIEKNSIVMGNPAKVVSSIDEQMSKWENRLSVDDIRTDS